MKIPSQLILSFFVVGTIICLLTLPDERTITPMARMIVGQRGIDAGRTAPDVMAPQGGDAGTAAESTQYVHAIDAQGSTAAARPLPPSRAIQSDGEWAFVETFDGNPAAPSQDLLPRSLDYAVTHRTLPGDHLKEFEPYPADHGMDCSSPDPAVSPLPQHMVVTSHHTDGSQPDQSFFICKDHLMSSMGEVEGYSVSAFWPKQAFDFTNGGVLEFDVNISNNHPRSWWEVLLIPRNELRVSAAHEWLPIDETYPADRILFSFFDSTRSIQVGAGAIEPAGIVAEASDWGDWASRYPADPANGDRRIRRTMRITFAKGTITWAIRKEDGTFDELTLDAPSLPFTQGLVLFKTHAYTPKKEENTNNYTFHWDNIRFSGPVVGQYESYETAEIAYLQANGNREIGESASLTINLPAITINPILFGQVSNAMRGQVLLSINQGSPIVLHPAEYNVNNCYSTGWKSFVLPIDASWLHEGKNTFTWMIGPRPTCAEAWLWDGFSIKNLEVQSDLKFDHAVHLPVIEH